MTTRNPQIVAFLESLRQRADMDEPTAQILLDGAEHPYGCRCATCLEWWAAVGPEDLGDGGRGYGPFTEAEIAAFKRG